MADPQFDNTLGMVAPQPEPQGLLARHFWAKHIPETNAHNLVINELASAAHDPQLQSPEAAHLLNSTLYQVSSKKPADNYKFLNSGKLQQILDQAGAMEKSARAQNQPPPAPPPSLSLQGSQPQGGTTYGKFAGIPPPPDALGQQGVAQQQTPPIQGPPQTPTHISPMAPPPGMNGFPDLSGLPLGPVRTSFGNRQVSGQQDVAKAASEDRAKVQEQLNATKDKTAFIMQQFQSPEMQAIGTQLEQQGYPKNMIPVLQGAMLGVQIPSSFATAMTATNRMVGIKTEDFARQYPEEFAASGIDPKVTPVLDVVVNKMSGKPMQIQGKNLNLHFADDGNGNVIGLSPVTGQTLANTGAVAPAMVTPHVFAGQSGNPFLASAAQIAGGGTGTPVPGAVTPSMLPTTSTLSVPGQLDQKTRRIKDGVTGMTAPPGAPAKSSGSSKPIPKTVGTGLIGRMYMDWATGGKEPAGKGMIAVQQYMDANDLPAPIQLSATGQKGLQQVDAVYREIDDLMKPLNNAEESKSLRGDYVKYKLGFATPHDELFTKLSFEGLRSVAAAMAGNNSRAYPVIQRAFQHVPNLDRLGGFKPDDISLIKDKLKSIKDVLESTRQSILVNERKSGVIPGLTAPPSGEASAPIVQHSPSTGAYRYSSDGGKTWQAGQPPK